MRKFFFSLFTFCFLLSSNAQIKYWQQQVNFKIDVSLNEKDHTLDGFSSIEYINNSPDTLHFIWFHVWPNAYKNDKTAFSNQLLQNGNTDFYFSETKDRGYINRLTFNVNNITAVIEDHPSYIDVIKLLLPSPLSPGSKINISNSFHVKLPKLFSRSGHDGNNYQVTQWYPKPAVYDQKGWHPMPYLDQGEFYSEFGNYDVQISLPENYVVAATGELQNQNELKWMQNKTETKNNGQIKTLQYKQNNIHDFAWFASKDFLVSQDSILLNSGRKIYAYSFYTAKHKDLWKNSIQVIKDAIKTRSEWIGEYPYNTVSAVQGWEEISGGMEYPTITVIGNMFDESILDLTLEHEIGHNWFHGILASNERMHPWMDEGINTFYDNRYAVWKNAKPNNSVGKFQNVSFQKLENILFKTKAVTKLDQPIELNAEAYTYDNYGLIAYHKTSKWMELLENEMGKEVFDQAMKKYYTNWKFKHPYPDDFKKIMSEVSNKNLDSVFSLLNKKGPVFKTTKEELEIISLLTPKKIAAFVAEPSKNLLWLNPVFGLNSYDKFMPGLMISNYKLPPSPFQYFITPLYSTGTKKLVGLAKMNYNLFTDGSIRKFDFFVNASTFTDYAFTDAKNNKTDLTFQKIVPGFRLTFKEKDPRSNVHKHIQFKSFLIKEENFRFSRDTIIRGIDTTIIQRVNAIGSSRNMQQLDFVLENNRSLYPYSANLRLEQATDFIRTAFTGKYFFNYPKAGGLNVRLFAGKFFYTGSKTQSKQLKTDRFHLNMTGASGYEDYTYSDYFIGRNQFENTASQQIMIRDGGFKIRTELLANEIGKTDDWLMAVNLNSSIPDNVNPLRILPFKIPLSVFLDIGTQAEAWKKNSSADRFLFDAGLQVSFFKETLNIYLPLFYSKVYKDYIQNVQDSKNRFLKTISFNIDISNFNLRKTLPELAY